MVMAYVVMAYMVMVYTVMGDIVMVYSYGLALCCPFPTICAAQTAVTKPEILGTITIESIVIEDLMINFEMYPNLM